jgi:methionyl-tRNA synthetase
VASASASPSPNSASTSLSGFLSDPIPGAFKTISIETGSQVEWIEEENYMFRLGTFKDDLLSYYRSHPRSVYPEQYREDTLKMLGDGQDASFTLADISISRPRSRLEWGIQVPDDPLQTIYVWFDALLVYLTGSGYPWKSTSDMGWWPADLQIIGKDILRFHAIYLPAVLLALSAHPYPTKSQPSLNGLPLSTTILTHAHWTSSQKKMSKSLGNVADPLEAIEKWGVDTVRFYLMRVGGRWKDDVGENLNLKLSFIAVTSVDRLVPFSARQAPQRNSSTAGQLFLADHLSSSC